MLNSFCVSKVHVSKESKVADHCRTYALSYPQDNDYITVCNHEHDSKCDRCELLPTFFLEVKSVIGSVNCSAEEQDEMEHEISQSIQSIEAWKAHLLRAINQDAARHEILENLDAQAVLVVMDWAMKFLARKLRESQSDWFGKRGIPLHISVALRKNANDETELFTFVHASKAVTRIAPLYSPLLITFFVNLRKSCQKSTLFICGAITQDAIIARLHYF